MTSNDRAVLISRFLADDLQPAERDALAAVIHDDPSLRRELLSHQRLSIMIHAASIPRDDPRVVSCVLNALRASRALRVVRGVRRRQTRQQQQRRTWAIGAAAAAVLAAGLAIVVLAPANGSQAPSPREVAQPVVVQPAPARDAAQPVVVQSAPTSHGWAAALHQALSGTVGIPGGGNIRLAPGAQATADGDEQHPVVALTAGRADCRVAPRAPGASFAVRTPQGEAAVVGTGFAVLVGGDGTRVEVSEGTVAVTAGGVRGQVPAGGLALMFAGQPPSVFLPVASVIDTGPVAWNFMSPHSQVTAAGSGPTGANAVTLSLTQNYSWAGASWLGHQPDWSRYAGISVVIKGRGDGHPFWMELLDNVPSDYHSTNLEACERFRVKIVDDRIGWREIRLPFSTFDRFQPADAAAETPHDGLTLSAMHGISFIGDTEAVEFTLERLALFF